MRRINFIILIVGLLSITLCCSSPLNPDETYSLSEIKKYAKNGQIVKSRGILAERSAKREFVVQDNKTSVEINLGRFKKESKYLDKDTKIVFSGIYSKKLFGSPKIDIESLQVVEEFK